jgi:cytochrome c oxidase subunit II
MSFVFLFAVLGSLLASDAAVPNQASLRHVDVVAKRFAFEPASITLKRGQSVDLVLKSTDVAHGLRFRELNLDLKVPKEGRSEIHFTPTRAGTFIGHCSVFCGAGHGSMTLTLHVVD